MRSMSALLFAGALTLSVPLAFADDLVIAPEIGVQFHNDVKTKKIKSRKHEGDLAVGVVVEGDDVEYYEVPADVVVAQPEYKTYRYAYINDRVYLVDTNHRIVAVVE